MKKLFLFFFLVISSNFLFAQKPDIQALYNLQQTKQFFALRDSLNKYEKAINATHVYYLKSFLYNAFGKYEQSNRYIEKSLQKPAETSGAELVTLSLLNLQVQNYVGLGRYKAAADILHTLIREYYVVLDSAAIRNYANTARLWGALSKAPEQAITVLDNTTVPLTRDKGGLMNIPVTVGDSTFQFVFDTGANLCTITQGMANRLGVKVLSDSIMVGGINGGAALMKTGVLKECTIGEIRVENVAFLIAPDSSLYFPQIDYHINGIIGFPVIFQMKEVHVFTDGRLFIPREPTKSKLNNLALDGLYPIVKAYSNKKPLMMNLDSGASNSSFFMDYFEKYKAEVETTGELGKKKQGGFDGVMEHEVYNLTNMPLTIGTQSLILPQIDVEFKSRGMFKFDGVIGQDVISHFSQMIMNFDDMYLDFK